MVLGSKLARDQRGVSAMEYALLAAMIALGIVSSLDRLGSSSAKGFTEAGEAFPGSDGNGNNGNGKGKAKGKNK